MLHGVQDPQNQKSEYFLIGRITVDVKIQFSSRKIQLFAPNPNDFVMIIGPYSECCVFK